MARDVASGLLMFTVTLPGTEKLSVVLRLAVPNPENVVRRLRNRVIYK